MIMIRLKSVKKDGPMEKTHLVKSLSLESVILMTTLSTPLLSLSHFISQLIWNAL